MYASEGQRALLPERLISAANATFRGLPFAGALGVDYQFRKVVDATTTRFGQLGEPHLGIQSVGSSTCLLLTLRHTTLNRVSDGQYENSEWLNTLLNATAPIVLHPRFNSCYCPTTIKQPSLLHIHVAGRSPSRVALIPHILCNLNARRNLLRLNSQVPMV